VHPKAFYVGKRQRNPPPHHTECVQEHGSLPSEDMEQLLSRLQVFFEDKLNTEDQWSPCTLSWGVRLFYNNTEQGGLSQSTTDKHPDVPGNTILVTHHTTSSKLKNHLCATATPVSTEVRLSVTTRRHHKRKATEETLALQLHASVPNHLPMSARELPALLNWPPADHRRKMWQAHQS